MSLARFIAVFRSRADFAVLAVILLLAVGLRGYGLTTWDANTHQHPDERFLTILANQLSMPDSLASYFDTQRSPINPYANGQDHYAYGQLPLTITRWAAEATGQTGFDQVNIVGRVLSVLSDLATILFAWLLARRIFGERVAHLAGLLLALTVLDIQLSHFFAVDTFATGFAAASLYFGQRAWDRDSLRDAALAGLAAGLGMACKISVAALLPALFLTLVWPRRRALSNMQVLDGLVSCAVVLLGAAVAFRVAEPYAFLGPAWSFHVNTAWVADKIYWAQISSGVIDVPYMIQWAGTTPYVFWLQAIVQWGMGPALGIASLVGLVVASWRWLRGSQPERSSLLLLLWTLGNLAYFGGEFAKFLRYLLPIYFTLAIFAAYLLVSLADSLRSGRPWSFGWLRARVLRLAWLAPIPALVVVLGTAGWAAAFTSIYAVPHSRIQASDWIYANIPAGATLASEVWDDQLPLNVDGGNSSRYRYVAMPLYDPESDAKRQTIITNLNKADYVILASRRLEGSIPKLPERYPMASKYYDLLNSGELGFHLVQQVQVEPRLGPIAIDDSRAQEDFTVYDHPLVQIWQKSADYSPQQVAAELNAIPINQAVNVKPIDGGKGALLLSPSEQQAVDAGGTWSSLFDRLSWVNQVPLIPWLLAAELVALAAAPLLWRTLRFLPDGGFGISKIAGLVLLAYLAWLPASLKLIPFGRASLVGAWLLMAIAAGLVVWSNRSAFLAWLRREKWLLITTELVFLIGFGLFLWIRGINPDLWHPSFGGEKPMNFAYLNAVVKSDYFPPYDPWFAGGIINYYYFGFVLVAALIKVTGILPQIAFNLAQPTLYGAVCAATFGTAFALAAPARRFRIARGGTSRVASRAPVELAPEDFGQAMPAPTATLTPAPRLRPPSRVVGYVAGVLGVLLLAIVGNLDAGLELLDALAKLGAQYTQSHSAVVQVLQGVLAVIFGQRFPPLDFWHPTRFIGPEAVPPIHEFPYFTFLYGDLHAHQIALPITIASLAVSLNLLLAVRREPDRWHWWPLVWLGLLLGVLRATNTWDMPTYTGIAIAGLALGYAPALLRLRRTAWVRCVVSAAVLVALSQAFIYPWLQRYQLFYTGVDPFNANTALDQYLTINGLMLFCVGSLFAWYGVLAWRRRAATRTARVPSLAGAEAASGSYFATGVPIGPWLDSLSLSPSLWIGLVGAALGLGFWRLGYETRGFLCLASAIALSVLLTYWRRPNRAFQAGLVATALLVTLAPEFVALQGDIGRMNTVFKLYYQAWTLLAICGAVAVAWLLRAARVDRLLRAARGPWLVVAAVLLFAGLSYPLFASQSKLNLRFADLGWGLDGMAYMDHAAYTDQNKDLNLPGDAQAIRWMQDNIQGTPTILEGRSPVYRWGNRFSIYTGLPSVLGWDVHESQQRTAYTGMIQQRAADVQRAYDSPSASDALAILRAYNVKYVVVGGLERAYYSAAGLAKFGQMPQLQQVYNQDGVQIYQVIS